MLGAGGGKKLRTRRGRLWLTRWAAEASGRNRWAGETVSDLSQCEMLGCGPGWKARTALSASATRKRENPGTGHVGGPVC